MVELNMSAILITEPVLYSIEGHKSEKKYLISITSNILFNMKIAFI